MLSITDALSSHRAAIIIALVTVIIDVLLLGLVRRARPATV
jgi:hypothetical protein